MSLTSFVKQPEIAAKLERLHSGLRRDRNTEQNALVVPNGPKFRVVRRLETGWGCADGSDYPPDCDYTRGAAWRILTGDGQRIPIKTKPRSKNYPLVGAAFDYLLRFELQRRAPHAILSPWVAQDAAAAVETGLDPANPWKCLLGPLGNLNGGPWANLEALKRGDWVVSEGIPPSGFRPRNSLPILPSDLADCLEIKAGIFMEAPVWPGDPRTSRIMRRARPFESGGRTWIRKSEISRRVAATLTNATRAVDRYSQTKEPTPGDRAALAAHAIRLAKLDLVRRRWVLVPDFEEADPEDVRDLVDLLAITPFSDLINDRVLLLNPTFGEASRMIGGADADLIVGDMLVDIKTTKSDTIKLEHINQLLGYFLLARQHRAIDPTFPVINRIGLYYSRYGYLHSFEASSWTDHPAFPETERWFFAKIERPKRRLKP